MRPIAAGRSRIRGTTPRVEAAFGQRGPIRPLRARLSVCRRRAQHARAVGRVARSAGRVAGCRGTSPGAPRHLHAVPLRDASASTAPAKFPPCHAGPSDRAWRSDARRPPLAAARRAHARPAVSFDRARRRCARSGEPEGRFPTNRSSKPIGWRATVLVARLPRSGVLRDDQRLRSFAGRALRADRDPVACSQQRHRDFEWIVLENGPVSRRRRRGARSIVAIRESSASQVTENCLASRARFASVSRRPPAIGWSRSTQTMCSRPMRWRSWPRPSRAGPPISSSRTRTTWSTGAAIAIREARVRSGPQHRELVHLASVARSAAIGALALGAYSDSGRRVCHDWDTSDAIRAGGRGDGARAARALPLAHPCRIAEQYRDAEPRHPGIHARRGRSGIARRGRGLALRDRRVPAFSRRCRMVDSPPADRRSQLCHRGAGRDPGRCRCARARARLLDRQPRRAASATSGDARGLADARRRPSTTTSNALRCSILECRPTSQEWVWEATKWFELQPDTAIVGGRILDDRDVVVDAGSRVERRRHHGALPGSPSSGRRRVCSCAEAADDRGASRGLSRRRSPLPGGRHRGRHA